ncbi:MAG: hypothetical protein K6L80_12175 [Agarilytica sp.]
MNIFEKLMFLINKPLVLYMYSPIIFLDYGARSGIEKAGVFAAFIVGVALIIAIEKAISLRRQIYKPARVVDESAVIEIAGRYLNRDYSSVQVFKKSLRGKLVRRGFEDEFHIQAKGGNFIVTIGGSFPFPISLMNRAQISGDIEQELRSHSVHRA